MSARRPFFVPETIQTSVNDCGPGALAALLAGLGVEVGAARLRALCRTEADGTSIDGLEEVCEFLGLEAEQMVVPAQHLLIPTSDLLPCIAVTRTRLGPHFVTAWKRVGPWVQLMDPAHGRRWQRIEEFVANLMPFDMQVDALEWREWATEPSFVRCVGQRLRALGVGLRSGHDLVEAALSDESWVAWSRLDAAARYATALVEAGAARRGSEAQRLLCRLVDPVRAVPIPRRHWSAEPLLDVDKRPQARLHGAVVLKVRPRPVHAPSPSEQLGGGGTASAPITEPDVDAVHQDRPTAAAVVAALMNAAAAPHRRLTIALLGAAGIGVVLELVLMRGLIELLPRLQIAHHRFEAFAAAAVFAAVVLAIEFSAGRLVVRAGRRLEWRLRRELAEAFPRLDDNYLRTRQTSDLATRVHHTARIRELPDLLAQFVRALWELVAIAIAITLLNPGLGWDLGLVVAACVAVTVCCYPLAAERDLRARRLSTGLARFYLDALRGALPVRSHGAEAALAAEHAEVLADWQAAAHSQLRLRVLLEGTQLTLGLAGAAWLVVRHLSQPGAPSGSALLVAYLALFIPLVAQRLGLLTRRLVSVRNHGLRAVEALTEPTMPTPATWEPADRHAMTRGARVEYSAATVSVGGAPILSGVDLQVEPGQHVAVVGASGSGKSTLVGLLLGHAELTGGTLHIDAQPADRNALRRLASQTAWIDPATQLWNRSVLDNLTYATTSSSVGGAVRAAGLTPTVARLEDGLQARVGEAGRLLSGGEGQRVRVGRAYLHADARLVIADEALRGLDAPAGATALKTLRSRWSHATMMYVTHRVTEALTFDRVVVLQEGTVAEVGDPKLLAQRTDSLFARMLASQGSLESLLDGPRWRRIRLDGGRLEPIGEPQ